MILFLFCGERQYAQMLRIELPGVLKAHKAGRSPGKGIADWGGGQWPQSGCFVQDLPGEQLPGRRLVYCQPAAGGIAARGT